MIVKAFSVGIQVEIVFYMLQNYLKIAWRNLQRNKVFAVINISGLAIGIAASLLLFVIVKYELSYEKFQKNYNNIYHVVTQIKFSDGMSYNPGIATPALEALRTEFPDVKFAGINSANGSQVMIPAATVESSKKFIEKNGFFFCDPQFFSVFNSYQWLSGSPSVLSDPNSVALSRMIAAKYFGSWQNAIGKTIRVDNIFDAKVNGILEDGPKNTDLPLDIIVSYATLKNNGELYGYNNDWGNVGSNNQVFALLPSHVSAATIDKRLLQFSKEHYPGKIARKSNFLQPLSVMHFDTRLDLFSTSVVSKSTLWTLSLIGVVILIMACINFINLSTAQSVQRSKEVGIRKVLGSNRLHLFKQMMGETALIVSISVAFAIGIVYLSLPYIKHIASINEDLSIFTLSTLLILAGLAVVVILLAGIYPSFVLSSFNPITALKNKMVNLGNGSISLRRSLVVLQFGISQVLIIATIVAVSQMNFINNADLGFNKEAVLVLSGNTDSVSLTKLSAFKQQLLALPGVQSVSLNSDMPSSPNLRATNFAYNHKADEDYQVYVKFADTDYLRTYGVSLLAGKNYEQKDTLNEVLINHTLVSKLGIKNPADAVGKSIRLGGGNSWQTIAGVLEDFKTTSLRDEIRPLLIEPMQSHYNNIAVKLRTNNLAAAQTAVQNVWNRTYPEYAYNATFFDDSINQFYEQEQQLSLLYKIFAGLAIFISCLGLYGLVSFMAVQKTKEVGIRKVLGAGISHIVFIFSKEFTILILIAFAIAAPVAWYISSSWLSHFAYRINIGAWTFVFAILASVIIAWITVGYKAIKAAVVNPVKSLRSE